MEQYREWIEIVAQGIEALAVAIMAGCILVGTIRWLYHLVKEADRGYERYRVILGRSLLIGLELLVAADIIQTVTLDSTLMSLALLGGLVAVRTFLGWTVALEVEGHWPWQKSKDTNMVPKGEN